MTFTLKHMVLWLTVIQFAFLMFYGSCHCLNKTSVPHLTLFSCEFIMLNQLFPQQPCCYKHGLKTSVSIRKICCSGEVSFMCLYFVQREWKSLAVFYFCSKLSFCLYPLCHRVNFLLTALPWWSAVFVGVGSVGLTFTYFDLLSFLFYC